MQSADTKAASVASRLFGGALPPDVLLDARRRLRIACLACVLANCLTLAAHFVLVRAGWSHPHRTFEIIIGVSVFVWLGLYWVFGLARLSPPAQINLGLFAECLLCYQMSNMELRGPDPRDWNTFGVSIVAMIIVLAPVLVPSPPWKTLLVSLLCASLGPLAFFFLPPAHDLIQYFKLFAVNYVAAGLSLAPALVLGRMREELQEAREFGSYKLLQQLGKGGMGEVWSARHRLLVRPAAIKLIGPELGQYPDPVVMKRFEQEVQATALLRSPHTITVYDYGIAADGTFYYVMELLEGLDLGALVDQSGPLPPARVVFLLAQMLDSLEEAHANGLVHRDIKPENVYACRQALRGDFVKVLDFGLALSVSMPADARLTLANAIHGTPAFMAPEQALEKPVDGRTDLYAVGCLAYWLLSGKTVFPGQTPVEHIVYHVGTPAPGLPGLPEELQAILSSCLEKDPELRPANARALRERLLACALPDAWTQADADAWWDSFDAS